MPFDCFLFSVDILGYSFMSVSTLVAPRVFTGGGLERVIRLFLTANGLLLPFIALQMYVHWMIWIAALWAVTFPGSAWSLAVLFHRLTPAMQGSKGQAYEAQPCVGGSGVRAEIKTYILGAREKMGRPARSVAIPFLLHLHFGVFSKVLRSV
jgi:hypothetical protein